MNVLVYSGAGTTTESVKHCLESLKLHLSPYYAVITINKRALLADPWVNKTSLLVIPGGADLPYCDDLNGEGNARISQFVRKGGKFIGFCAGGYFASGRIEFEVGNPQMEVSGRRELKFFPGVAEGCAYKGFHYDSHEGSRATKLRINRRCLPDCDEEVYCYYNGGCVFKDASKYDNVDILATYTEQLDVSDEEGAAIISCKVNKGRAILCGTHPEFSPLLMHPNFKETQYAETVEKLKQTDVGRRTLMKLILHSLGLKVNKDINFSIPKITPIYLSSQLDPEALSKLMQKLRNEPDFEHNVFRGNNDTFCFHEEAETDHNYFVNSDLDEIEDPQSAIKHIKIFESTLPSPKETPYFNMSMYFNHLKALSGSEGNVHDFGRILGYAEVVSSTNTMLEANPQLLRSLPNGFALTATTQVSGKGRGGNVWINPKGVMALSFLFKVVPNENQQSSLVTLQYLCSLAMTELILGYDSLQAGDGVGYEDMPVRIKWPNDLYCLKPDYFNSLSDKDDISKTVDGDEEKVVKISGTLINSQYIEKQFHLVCGIGVNVSNSAPTTSLNIVLEKLNKIRERNGQPQLAPYRPERLLAKFMHTMNLFYDLFLKSGIKPFLPLYYKRWFHTSQIVEVTSDGQKRKCVINGITPDYGLLSVRDLATNKLLELQPDGNSFDIFKGLIYRKS